MGFGWSSKYKLEISVLTIGRQGFADLVVGRWETLETYGQQPLKDDPWAAHRNDKEIRDGAKDSPHSQH